MSEITPSNPAQLTDYEFEALVKSGAEIVEPMIMQRVRIVDNDDLMEDVYDYLDINIRSTFYVRKLYRAATIYFADPIEMENVQRLLHTLKTAKNPI